MEGKCNSTKVAQANLLLSYKSLYTQNYENMIKANMHVLFSAEILFVCLAIAQGSRFSGKCDGANWHSAGDDKYALVQYITYLQTW